MKDVNLGKTQSPVSPQQSRQWWWDSHQNDAHSIYFLMIQTLLVTSHTDLELPGIWLWRQLCSCNIEILNHLYLFNEEDGGGGTHTKTMPERGEIRNFLLFFFFERVNVARLHCRKQLFRTPLTIMSTLEGRALHENYIYLPVQHQYSKQFTLIPQCITLVFPPKFIHNLSFAYDVMITLALQKQLLQRQSLKVLMFVTRVHCFVVIAICIPCYLYRCQVRTVGCHYML